MKNYIHFKINGFSEEVNKWSVEYGFFYWIAVFPDFIFNS